MGRRYRRAKALALAALTPAALAGLAFLHLSWKLPSVASLKNYRPPVATEVFSHDFFKIGEFARERRIYVPLQQVPPLLVKAFVAAEDDRFFSHRGISLPGILRAMLKNLIAGEVKQGGSTITQQVAKSLLLSPERSVVRKSREVILAYKMERFLSKERILEIYLNQVYLGQGAYGVQAAAQTYFQKDVTELTLGEMAVIAGLPRAPSRDNPYADRGRAREKQAYVLARMESERYVSPAERQQASAEELLPAKQKDVNLRYAPYFVEHVRKYAAAKYGDALVLEGGLQIYTTLSASLAGAAERALRAGVEELDRHQGYQGPIEHVPAAGRPAYLARLSEENGNGPLAPHTRYRAMITEIAETQAAGMQVYVSLGSRGALIPFEDMRWARKPNSERFWENDLISKPSQALKVGDVVWVERLRAAPDSKAGARPDALLVSLAQEPKVQGALLAVEPRTGAVRAMVGGYDFEKNEFNRAVQAFRQPGSAFKPIIYSAALDRGYTAASMIVDSPIVYDDPTTDLTWRPKNYEGTFRGETIFRECLIESRNVPTVKIVQDIGIDGVIDNARRLGIQAPLARDFSLALGSSAVTPMELVGAYAVFAAGGRKAPPLFIRKIVDRDGRVLERNDFDDPSLDLIEQAAVANQRAQALAAVSAALESGKEPRKPLPDGYALSPQTSYIMTHLLKQVIREGTGRRAAAINRPAAGKTGTTNENRDVWFVGFTPTLVAGVWLGFDKDQTLGPREMGGHAATPVWLEFMREAIKDKPAVDFTVPDGIVFAQIDPRSGKLATPKTKASVFEAFRDGTSPQETAEEAKKKKSPQEFFLQE